MDSQRWQQIEDLYNAVLARTPEERSALLDQADPETRREVEQMLAQRGSLMDRPAWEALPEDTVTMFAAGRRLGRYEIEGRLGAGGMGEVFRARDTRLNRTVALKVSKIQFNERFEREARAIAALNHPNICQLYDVGASPSGSGYLVMELIEGESPKGPLPLGTVLKYAAQLAAGLEAAHQKGIVHRDLKPANLKITSAGVLKILDFGLAKQSRDSDGAVGENSPTMSVAATQAGMILGTAAYMSPEQARGETVDARSDLWSFGVVLYEMVAGARPFDGSTSPIIFDALLNKTPQPVRERNPKVPAELERIIGELLKKDRALRYPSAAEVRDDLERLQTSLSAAAVGGKRKPLLTYGIAAAAALILAAGGFFYWQHSHAGLLTEKDTIIVAEFTNTTGDAVFDGTLRQGLSVQLQQTPFLQLVSDDQIGQTLRLMEKPPDTRLTPDVAREICRRANATTEIQGSIAALGNQYVLGLNAVNCSSGQTLAGEQVTADGKEKVIAALGSAASQLRSKLGESRASLEKFDVPLDQVTTSSVEALQASTLGTQALFKGDFPSAIPFYERAVTIDPDFAMTYSIMGIAYDTLGDSDRAVADITKGYNLRDRTSEREKFSLSGNYNGIVVGDVEKAAEICEQWTKLFPRDPPAFIGLGAWASLAGRLEQQLAAFREVLRLDPTPYAYRIVVAANIVLGRFEEARATIRQAKVNHIDSAVFQDELYYLAFFQNDPSAMAAQVAGPWVGDPPASSEEAQSYTAAYSGHLSRARDLEQRAIATAKQQGANNAAAGYQMNAALLEALFGNFPEAQKGVKNAGSVMTDRDLEGQSAMVWALAGDAAQAEKLAGDLDKRFPEATYIRFGSLPAVRGILAIRQGNLQEGIENLRAISSHALISPFNSFTPPMVPAYISGEAYLDAHRGAEAAAAFQTIIDHAGVVINFPIGALAHLGLGRAYAMQGDTAKARAAYQDFLTLWKDADPDVPLLVQARKEYAALQ